MKAGEKAKELIKSFEGCRLKAYKDSAGIPTIGWGTIMYADGSRVRMGDAITQFQADALLSWQIDLKAIAVDKLLRPYVVSQTRFDVLVSFCYNVGVGALEKSTLLRLVKKNPEDPAITGAFLAWNKATIAGKLVEVAGLTRRRRREAAVWFDN